MFFTKQEKIVLISLSVVLFIGSFLNYAHKRFSSFEDIIGFVESERIYRKININTATAEQLQRLPYVGHSVAGNIITYRQERGSFSMIEQLKEVKGIGANNLKRIAPHIYIKND